jgi:secondary thiamine-phosphate synthase enzyme
MVVAELGTAAALQTLEIGTTEPLLLEDLRAFLTAVAPPDAPYRHNDLAVRTAHMHPDESPNGHAHCAHLLLGASEHVPVHGGKLLLGTWQRIFLIELDGPRPCREVLVQMTGAVSGVSW